VKVVWLDDAAESSTRWLHVEAGARRAVFVEFSR
jgi:hypothetical protein